MSTHEGQISHVDERPQARVSTTAGYDTLLPQELVGLALSSIEPIELADHVVNRLAEQFALKACSVWLRSDDGGWLMQASQAGFARTQDPVPLTADSDAVIATNTAKTVIRTDTSGQDMPETSKNIMSSLGPEAKSYVVLPLHVEDTVMGALIMVWPEPRAFEDDEVAVLEGMAQALALGFDHAQLIQREMRATQLLKAHVENSPLAIVEFDAEFHLIQWSPEAERLFGYEAVEVLGRSIGDFLWVYEEDQHLVEAESARLFGGSLQRSKNVNRNYRKDGSVVWCEWYSSALHDASGKLTSVLSLVLDITERRQAEESKQQELERTELLLGAAETLARETSLDEVLALLCETVLSMVSHSRATVLIWDSERRTIRTAASVGDPSVRLGKPSISIDELSSQTRRVIEDQVSALVDYDALAPNAPVAHGVGSRLAFHAPLSYRGRLLGVLSVDDPSERRTFTQRDMALIEGVASHASVAIENARLYQHQVEQAQRMAVLKEIAETGSSAMRSPDIADRLTEIVVELVGADSAALMRMEADGGLSILSAAGCCKAFLEQMVVGSANDQAVQVLSTGTPVWVTDIESADISESTLLAARADGIRSFALVPLRTGDHKLGMLSLSWTSMRESEVSELAFIQSVASQLGVATENARLYEIERGIAETLQETLVIVPTHVPGVRFSRSYESATYERGRVGGDFVDIFEVAGPVVAITLGDVSGKGIDAAVTTSLIRTTLRVHALDGLPPVSIAVKANQMLRRFTRTESFVTLWFGLLNTETGHLRYVCAGHPPALIMGADGAIRELQCADPILGAFDEAEYFEWHSVLEQGDRLVLYSDGVTEARASDGRFLGTEGLLAATSRHAPVPTEQLSAAIMGEVVSFSQGVLRDDAALLTVEGTSIPGRMDNAI